jgi:hypothetical protein
LPQRLKPSFIFWDLYGTSELVPFPSVMGLPFVVCFGCSRLASAAEAVLHFLGFYGTSQLVPFPSFLLTGFAEIRHDQAREGHDFQSCR